MEPEVGAFAFDVQFATTVSAAVTSSSHKSLSTQLPAKAGASSSPPPSAAFLYLARDAANLFPDLLWAERAQSGAASADALVHFTAYDWQVCGESALHPVVSSLEVVLDLRQAEDGSLKAAAAGERGGALGSACLRSWSVCAARSVWSCLTPRG